jgi:hypothetical protein
VKYYVVLERITDEDRTAKRCGIEDRVLNGDTNSSCSGGGSGKGLRDEFCTHWFLQSSTTLYEDEA